jgi:hypothetical protein
MKVAVGILGKKLRVEFVMKAVLTLAIQSLVMTPVSKVPDISNDWAVQLPAIGGLPR